MPEEIMSQSDIDALIAKMAGGGDPAPADDTDESASSDGGAAAEAD